MFKNMFWRLCLLLCGKSCNFVAFIAKFLLSLRGKHETP